MAEPFIVCDNLVKIYKVAHMEVVALQGLDLTVEKGELMAIVGASGSGKSTLLNVLGGLDNPSAGRVIVGGKDLLKLSSRDLDSYRRTQVGFIWQQTGRNLIPYLTAEQNIHLPMTLASVGRRQKKEWAQELLETIGLWAYRHSRLTQLSGGQQQRVALAVALANRSQLLLGDEPTGELDSDTTGEVLTLLRQMNERYNTTVILVTHDPQIASAVNRVVTIRDGRISSETVRRVGEVEAALVKGLEKQAPFYEEYVVVDGAGRLQLPARLAEEAGIGNRVKLIRTEAGLLMQPVTGHGASDGLLPLESDDGETPQQRKRSLWRWWSSE
jgi:ABC-type lipoprotein export system ATPase subunit